MSSVLRRFWRWIAFAAAVLCVAPAGAASGQPLADEVRWMGSGGEPLPFRSEEEVLEFLRSAEIVGLQDLPMGVTKSRVATLEKAGVRARAAFHSHHVVKEKQRMRDGSFIMYFRDSYTNQAAAWEVARLLGMTNTPPTVLREIEGREGSLQLWIENTRLESDRREEGLDFPDRIRAYRQVYDMDVFDALINNLDRTQRNFLWDRESWDLWLIDHTRAFGGDTTVLAPQEIKHCSRRLWKRLQSLDTDLVEAQLEPYMSDLERAALTARWQDLVKLIEKLIEREGENEVLFNHDDPGSVTDIRE